MSEETTTDIEDGVFEETTIQEEIIDNELEESTRAHLKDERKAHYSKLIEEDLQNLIKEAAAIRNLITSAKTTIKKKYYKKKFDKVNYQVRRYVQALQQLGALSTSEGTEDELNATTANNPVTE